MPAEVEAANFASLADHLDVNLDSRASSTILRIVEVAAELLQEHGEQGLRIADVQRISGISIGSLYHHFGNREGLIKAARAYQYVKNVPRDGEAIGELAVFARSAAEFVELLAPITREVQSADRSLQRLREAEFIGSAIARPDLFEALRTFQTEGLTEGEQIADVLIQRGWLKEGVSPRALALLAAVLSFGRIMGDFDLEPVDPDEWVHVVQLAIRGLFNVDREVPVAS
jgi:AcrR family transcriptional regulator